MKIQGAKKVHYDSGPNMTPLVDVVMVILIFLMLTGSFGGITHFLFASMPISKTGTGEVKEPPSGLPQTANLTIYIKHSTQNPTVRAFLDNNSYDIPDPSNPAEKTLEAKGLEQALVDARAKLIQSGSVDASNVQVIIAPNPDVQQQIVVKVYEAAYAQGFTKIGFKLPPK